MTPLSKNARIAGFLYLLLGFVGPIRLIIVPSKLFVSGDATATANNIASHEMLFRIGILSDLLTGTMAIFVALALYKLLEVVDRNLAMLMVILGSFMVTPIYFANTVNDAAALMFARGDAFLSAFSKPQRDAMALLFIRLHHHGVVANEIFWGLWLVPMGVLIYRSRFLPRFLGVWLIINAIAYLVQSFTGVLAPDYEQQISTVLFPALFGEVATMLWLLIMGAKERAQ